MRTTLDLSEDLLQKARKIGGFRTKKKMIETALESYIQRESMRRLAEKEGSMPGITIDLDVLRSRG